MCLTCGCGSDEVHVEGAQHAHVHTHPDGTTHSHVHDHGHSHTPHAGLVNLHLEITGSTPVNGPDKGDINLEGLIGISYGIIKDLDIRAGYFVPLTSPNDFSHGITAGVIFHF